MKYQSVIELAAILIGVPLAVLLAISFIAVALDCSYVAPPEEQLDQETGLS